MGFSQVTSAEHSRKVLVLFADTHAGHKLGLLTPGTFLIDWDEEGRPVPYEPQPTATQKYLAERFDRDLQETEKIADGSPIIIIHAGDLTHGQKYPDQLVSTRPADQITIAIKNLERPLQLPNVIRVRIVHGTQAHSLGENTAPVLVSAFLAEKYPLIDVASLAHGFFSVDGLKLDCAHHGPSPGIRAWTTGNRLRLYTRSVMQDNLESGEDPPEVLVRAHFHTGLHETVRRETTRGRFKTEAFILPAYCGLSEYGQQITRSKYLISNGLLVLVVEGGRLTEIHPLWRTVDLRSREEL